MTMKEKFPKALYEPLSRQEMIDLVEGKGARRPGVCCGHWLHIDELAPEKGPVIEELFERYPEDAAVYYLKKPATFAEPGEKYTWCDVKDADPAVGRTGSIPIDELTAISWETYDKISPDVPDPNDESMFVNFPKEDDGRYRICWMSNGPWCRLWDYRGMTNSLMDLYTDPERVHHVTRRVIDFFKAATKRGVEEANIDAIAFGDDLGMQKEPFISPEMFREFYFPYYKELCDYAHELGIHVWLHCCGDLYKLLPHMIEAGIDVIHPIQKYALDEVKIVNEFKDKVAFWAGMDLQRILPFGTVDEVKAEVHHFIDTFYTNGNCKMVFTLNNRIQDNVPIENFVAFIEESYVYGEVAGKKYLASKEGK